MSLRINTNVAALNAHNQLRNTDNLLSKSLERLSSGLRINKAADDASGMSIADSLRAQALGIKQAVANANDGISIVQIADGALQESINIVNSIRTKSIQAAQDGQTMESRKAIQSDIDKLMEELDMIAQTTAFNGQKLLSGVFTNKKFQVGAYSGERINISINSAESNKIGHVTTGKLGATNPDGGLVQLSIYSNAQSKYFDLNTIDLEFNNSAENGIGAMAQAVNKLSDSLGITATAIVKSTTDSSVKAGATGSDFAVNGVNIGQVNTSENDSDGSLVKAINAKSDQHGIVASVDDKGLLTLTSSDGRGIKVEGYYAGVLGSQDLNTFGYVRFNQMTSNEIIFYDRASGRALGFDLDANANETITTSIDSTLKAGSILKSGSALHAGTVLGFDLTGSAAGANDLNGDITTTENSIIKAGTQLADATEIAKNTVLGGSTKTVGTTTTDSDAASLIKAGSVLADASVIKAGTQVTTDIATTSGMVSAGTVLSNDVTLSGAGTLTADMLLQAESTIGSASTLTAGSYIGAKITLDTPGGAGASAAMVLTQDMVLLKGSKIIDASGTLIKAGSTIGGDFTVSGDCTIATNRTMTVAAGSTIASGSSFKDGSTLGGYTKLANDETLLADMTVKAGSVLASGTTLESGTRLTNDFVTTTGIVKAGTVLERDFVLDGDQGVSSDQTLAKDSVIKATSILGPNNDILTGTNMTEKETVRLSDLSVTSQDSAQMAISVAEAALKDLDAVRAGLGSVQNQLTSTIANLNVTKTNVFAAESNIRDVDFAEESANFSKMQVLLQAGTFAMAQANASQQQVLQLLQ